jgi:hypothetical protein
MSNWYGIKVIATGAIVGFITDDAPGFNAIPVTEQKVGPYATYSAAVAALTPSTLSQNDQTVATLGAKPSNAWTLADIADWLKAHN